MIGISLNNPMANAEFRESNIQRSYLSESYSEKLENNKGLMYKPIEEPKSNKTFFTEALMIILSIIQ